MCYTFLSYKSKYEVNNAFIYLTSQNMFLIFFLSDKKKGGKGGGFATISATHKVNLYSIEHNSIYISFVTTLVRLCDISEVWEDWQEWGIIGRMCSIATPNMLKSARTNVKIWGPWCKR